MSNTKLSILIGSILILTGVFVPSSALIESLRPIPLDLREELVLGALLFKIGLCIFGVFVMTLGRISIWTPEIYSIKPNPRLDSFIQTTRQNKINLTILTVILFLGFALRLYALNSGLWYDEILTYIKYATKPFGEIVSTYDSQNQHPFYSLLAHASFSIFGESAWALRLPAVLFGIGSIWVLYLFGREVSDTREAILATALLAFSYHHIWFSQNARGYTGLLFWTLLASWLFLRGLRETRPALWLLYASSAALGVYTHMTMLFVVIGHFLIYLMTLYTRRKAIWPSRWNGLVLGFSLAAFLTFQLHALVLPQIFDGTLTKVSSVTAWKNPLWTLIEVAKGMQMNFASNIAAFAALLVFGAGALSYTRTRPVILQLLLIPALLCAAMVIAMEHHLWPRLFFFTMGFGVLVIVRGTTFFGEMVARLLRLKHPQSVTIGTVMCASLILLSAISIPFVYGPKQDYLGALTFITERKNPDDTVVTVGLATFPYKSFYRVEWEAAESSEAVKTIRSRAKRTWLVYTFPIHLRSVYPKIVNGIRSHFQLVKIFPGTVRGGDIYVYRSVRTT